MRSRKNVSNGWPDARADWVRNQRHDRQRPLLSSGQVIGKQHTLLFKRADVPAVRSRLGTAVISISYPTTVTADDANVQRSAKTAAVRALRQEAEALLPSRLAAMAANHGLQYRSVNVRSLSGRWGSCDSDRNIVLNLYLMLLPWELIDYVLLHELTHTIVKKHGPAFWQQMEQFDPKTPLHRKLIRDHQPTI